MLTMFAAVRAQNFKISPSSNNFEIGGRGKGEIEKTRVKFRRGGIAISSIVGGRMGDSSTIRGDIRMPWWLKRGGADGAASVFLVRVCMHGAVLQAAGQPAGGRRMGAGRKRFRAGRRCSAQVLGAAGVGGWGGGSFSTPCPRDAPDCVRSLRSPGSLPSPRFPIGISPLPIGNSIGNSIGSSIGICVFPIGKSIPLKKS